jgi:uncharacterized beta-barrel protein YwiB (DUF1934 family)
MSSKISAVETSATPISPLTTEEIRYASSVDGVSLQVFVEDGRQGVVKIAYDLSGVEPKVEVTENAANLNVRISFKTPLSAIGGR